MEEEIDRLAVDFKKHFVVAVMTVFKVFLFLVGGELIIL